MLKISIAFSKRRKIDNLSVAPENIGKHFSFKIEGRKKVCVHYKRVDRKTSGGRSVETTFQCLPCSVARFAKLAFMNTTRLEIAFFITRVPICDATLYELSVSFKSTYDHDFIAFWPNQYLRSFLG